MALKDLVSDLSNFKGQSQYDKLDSQIKEGVDFFPNDDASGFTPKTNLESLYKKVQDGTFGEKWPGIAPKNQKTRQAYGKQGEYEAGDTVGRAIPNILGGNTGGTDYNLKFGGDTLGTPWSPLYPIIKDIASYVSLIRTTGFENSKLSLISIPKLFTPQEFETVGVSGPIDHSILSEKQRGVFNSYPVLEFEHRNEDNNIVGYSAHISPGGEINAGLRYGAMTDQSFVEYSKDSPLTDLAKKGDPKPVNIFPNLDIDSQYGSSFNSSTMDIPAIEGGRAYRQTGYADRTVYGNTVSSLKDLFRGSSLIGLKFQQQIDKFIAYSNGSFTGLPKGLDKNFRMNAGTTDF